MGGTWPIPWQAFGTEALKQPQGSPIGIAGTTGRGSEDEHAAETEYYDPGATGLL
jgi:hypothetical protein